MKRLVLFAALVLFTAQCAMSLEPRAIGVRLGNGAWASLQHYTANGNVMQYDLGWSGFSKKGRGLELAVTYNWEINLGSSDWYMIAGFGIGGGYEFDHLWRKKLWIDEFDENGNKTGSTKVWSDNSAHAAEILAQHRTDYAKTGYGFAGYAGLVLNLEFEYQLPSVPLSISLDWRPLIGADFGRLGNPNKKPVNTDSNPDIANPANYNTQVRYHMRGLYDFGASLRYTF
ncbi:MAG: hypothetical protein IJU35_08240 [Paludibacteraceae bacterium]|nr:hypothetical protein [Paludibacteraceae bacterium]